MNLLNNREKEFQIWLGHFFLTQQDPASIFSAEQMFLLEILFFSLGVRPASSPGLALIFSRAPSPDEVSDHSLTPLPPHPGSNTSQGALCCWWRPRRHKRSISTWELPCYLSWVTDEIFQSFVPLVLRRTLVFWGSLVHGYQVMWLARIETKSAVLCLLACGKFLWFLVPSEAYLIFWHSGRMMSEAAVQIPKSVGTYTEDSGHFGSAYVFFKISRRWSSANEGIDCEKSSFNNVAMMFLCLPTAVLLHPCCYQKEGVGTFLVCSCKSMGEELHTNTHASGSRRI